MEEKKIYLSLKLKSLLPIEVYKVADFLFACQKDGYVLWYTKNCTTMHLSKEEVEIAIQTLIDRHILNSPVWEENHWKFKIDAETVRQYGEGTWDDINDAPRMMMSREVKFTHQKEEKTYGMVDMSPEEMMRRMQELQNLIAAQMANKQKQELPY